MAFQRTLELARVEDFVPGDFVYAVGAPPAPSSRFLNDHVFGVQEQPPVFLPKHSPKTSFGDDAGGEGKDDAGGGKEGEKADAGGGGKAEKQDAGGGGSSSKGAPGGGGADAKQAEASEKAIERDPVFINMKEMLGVVRKVKNSLSTMDDALKDLRSPRRTLC